MKSVYSLRLFKRVPAYLWAFLLLPFSALAQVTPEAGTVECFLVGSGGLFVDQGGQGGSSDSQGAPGNYDNCDCVTTTTLCPVDGSALTVDFTAFGVGAAFDWLVILDGDNPDGETYPYSILADPGNAALQLFNNSNGSSAYGGADNYGAGLQQGVGNLLQMDVTSYTASNATGCLTFVFRASGTLDNLGWEAALSTADGAGHPGDDISCDVNISCFPVGNPYVFNITPGGAEVSWNEVAGAEAYIVEYGPAGFVPGNGIFVSTTETGFTLENLEEYTAYDVYIYTDCGNGELSLPAGPLNFQTPWLNPPTTCTYSLDLFDSFGDGWNGAMLEVNVDGDVQTFTISDGTYASYTFDVLDGVPIILTYTSGFYESEVSYVMYDSDGNPVFSDGPFPATGEVYNSPAVCPACPGISPTGVTVSNITESTADISWTDNGAAQQYVVEYGPAGFPQGIGLTMTTTSPSVTLTGLNSFLNYEFYIYADCGADGTSSVAGPFSFQTMSSGGGGATCTYTLQLHDSFGDGWNGAFLTVEQNGVATDYTIDFSGNGSDETYMVDLISNLPVTISYSPGFFESEVTFEILDPDGNIIYEDGPFPQTGVILEFLACPSCAGPTNFHVEDVNADNATFAWDVAQDAGEYVLEYGTFGFTLGTGTAMTLTDATSATITGLEENTYYDVYLSYTCDDGEQGARLGPILIHTRWFNDVGISGIFSPTEADCNLSAAEQVVVGIHNYGQNPQSLIDFFYAVNGQKAPIPYPTDGFFTGVVSNDSTEVVPFETLYDLSEPGYYLIEAWTALETDSNLPNDTFRVELITAAPLPLVEDFESGALDADWSTSAFNPIYAPNSHNNPTWVCGVNLYSFNNTFFLQTNRVGSLGPSEELSFEYRYVDWFAGTNATILGPDDKLEVQISTDCEASWTTVYTIDASNHTPTADFTEVSIDLSPFAGQAITVRFQATWGSGDYWLDLDNINVTGCPSSFILSANVQDESSAGAADGSISVSPTIGTAPFTYVWSNNAIGPLNDNLSAGTYSVTVTDANGCQEVAAYEVGVGTAVQTPDFIQRLLVAPNPTAGRAVVELSLYEPASVELDVFTALAQPIAHYEPGQGKQFRQELDLSEQPPGMYYLRIRAGEQVYMAKLLLAK